MKCFLVVACFAVTLALCSGCGNRLPKPLFNQGELIKVRVDNSCVMVLEVKPDGTAWNRSWLVHCRTGSSIQQYRDGVLSRDTEIVAYSKVWFYPYELERIVMNPDQVDTNLVDNIARCLVGNQYELLTLSELGIYQLLVKARCLDVDGQGEIVAL